MHQQGSQELKGAIAEILEMHQAPCAFRHELRGQSICPDSVRNRNLACAHSSSHKRLTHAIELLHQAGHIDEETSHKLQRTVNESGLRLEALDALVADRADDLSVDYPHSLGDEFVASLRSDEVIASLLEQQPVLSARLEAIRGIVKELSENAVIER